MAVLLQILLAGMPVQASAGCACEAAKALNTWCDACKVGYVAGIRIESALLYEELDAHGHDIDPDRIECPSCRKALAADGFCHRCNIGFVNEQAYLSKLAYNLALGERVDPDSLTCETCRRNAGRYGWCDRCHVGMVGNVRIRDRGQYARAVVAYETVLAAIERLPKCWICAAAMINDGYCVKCRIRYRDGKPVEPQTPEAAKDPDNDAGDGSGS
jgi:hypothetical protein